MADQPRGVPLAGSDAGPADADFLFHLYRGSELLRDNKVREAKSEIELALRLQPRDAQGQDLLARVYFRLGVYPRAIALYESLVADFPNEPSPRVNLALCYLKTGQPDPARQHLEVVVTADPNCTRAWGYLGLAFERMGDLDKAKVAFERGGHHAMARRIDDLILATRGAEQQALPPSSTTPVQMAEVRRVAEEAFHELDMTDMAFSLDAGAGPRTSADSGAWKAYEMGHDDAPAVSVRGVMIPSLGASAQTDDAWGYAQGDPPAPDRTAAPRASELVRDAEIVFPRPGRVSKRADGSVLVTADGDFACRLDLARVVSTTVGMPSAAVLRRRGRGGEEEPPVGDPIRPVYVLSGATHLVLCPAHDRTLMVLELHDDTMVAREEMVAGFDTKLAMECGRLPSGHGDMSPMLQLRGSGSVVLEARGSLGTLALRGAQAYLIRSASLVGWIGRPAVRNVPLSEAPASGRGWLSLTGDAWVLVDTSHASGFGQV
jgi:hypothetical protein